MLIKRYTLENHFKTLIEAMPLAQQKKVSKTQEETDEFKELFDYFQNLLEQESITLEEITEYKKLFRIENDTLAFSTSSLAKECARLFCHYLSEVYLPDETKGRFVGSIYLAGTQYAANITEIFYTLQIGDDVKLVREKENPHDEKAVKVTTLKGEKLGYIPARHNLFLSQMLDFGVELFAQIRKLKWDEDGVAIKIMIYA